MALLPGCLQLFQDYMLNCEDINISSTHVSYTVVQAIQSYCTEFNDTYLCIQFVTSHMFMQLYVRLTNDFYFVDTAISYTC